MDPSSEEIIEAISNSGYLFEQEVASILEKNNFHIKTNVAFKDEDEEKSREIDVMGFKRKFYDEEKKISVGIRILCECKNNTNPFVFICRNKNEADKNYLPPNFLFPQKDFDIPIEGSLSSYHVIPAFTFYNLNTTFPYHLDDDKAVQFCKIIRKGKDWSALHDGIYDGILMPVIKCLEYFRGYDDQYSNSEWKHYTIYFPIVVLNSTIYKIKSDVKPIELNQVDYISFIRDIHSKKIHGDYLIDFVKKDGLQKYIETIEKFVDTFITTVTK